MTLRRIPSLNEALESLRRADSEEAQWLEDELFHAQYYDDLTDARRLEILSLIVRHGSDDLKQDLFISLRGVLAEFD